MNDTTEKQASLNKYRKYRWAFIGLLLFIVLVEWYAKSSFSKSFASLDAAISQLANDEELPFKQFQGMKRGFPTETVDESGMILRKIHFVWSGVFKNYHLRLLVNENDNIVTYDTESKGDVAGVLVFSKKNIENYKQQINSGLKIAGHLEEYYSKMVPSLPLELEMIAEKKLTDSKEEKETEKTEDAKLEPVSDAHLQIEALMKKHPYAPLSGKKSTETQKDINKKWKQWWLERYLGSYKKYGNRDPKWDGQAIAFLQECCELTPTGTLRNEDAPVIIEKAHFLESSGCDDPIVRYFYLLARSKSVLRDQRSKLAEEALDSVVYKFQESKYPLEIQLEGSILLRDIANLPHPQWSTPNYQLRLRDGKLQAEIDHHWKAAQHLVAALEGKKLSSDERRFYLKYILNHFMIEDSKLFRLIIVTMEKSKNIDPWLTMMLKGRFYFRLATDIHAMHANYWVEPKMVSRNLEYLSVFQQDQAIIAQNSFEKAWMIDPTIPHAPHWVMLMTGKTGEVTTVENKRFWFDQVIQAQFDYEPAYETFIRILGFPFFKNREKQLLAFGEECLNTNRFDTLIPFKYFAVVHRLNSKIDPVDVFTQPSIYQNMEKMFLGYNSVPGNSKQEIDAGKSFIAYLHWVNGKREKAKKLVDELGSDFSGSHLLHFQVTASGFLRDLATPQSENKPFPTATGTTHQICFINAGKQFLTGSNTGKVTVWDVETQKKVEEFLDHSRRITSITYSRDRKLIATSSLDGLVILRNVEDFAIVRKLDHHDSVLQARFSPDGAMIAASVGDDDKNGSGISLWNTETFAKTGVLDENGGYVASLAWSPDGKTLAATSAIFDGYRLASQGVVLWDFTSTKPTSKRLNVFAENHGVRWSPDGKYLAVYGADHYDNQGALWKLPKIQIIDTRNHDVLHTFKSFFVSITDLTFTSDSQFMLTVGLDRKLVLWNLKTGARVSTVMDSYDDLLSIALSHDTQVVAYCGAKGKLETRTLEEIKAYQFKPKSLLENQFRAIRHMQLGPKGESLVIGTYGDGVRIWNTKTGKPLPLWFPVKEGYFMNHFDVSAKGTYIALACGNLQHSSGAVLVYQFKTGKLIAEHPFDWHGARCVQFSKDEKTLFSNGPEYDIIAWDTSTGKMRLWEMSFGHETHVNSMVISPDGKYLYTSSPSGVSKKKQRIDDRFNRWELPQENLNSKYFIEPLDYNLKQFRFDGARKLSVSPDGSILFANGSQYDLSKMKKTNPVEGVFLAVSPAGDKYAAYRNVINVAEGTQTKTISILPIKKETFPKFTLSNDIKGYILNAVFSPDGNRLYSADGGQQIIVWDLESRRPLFKLE